MAKNNIMSVETNCGKKEEKKKKKKDFLLKS